MSSFSAVDAAFSGFRIARERPVLVVVWAILMALISVAAAVATVLALGPTLAEIEALGQAAEADPQASLRLLGQLAPAFAVMLPVAALYRAVILAATYRVVLRPRDSGMAYLRLGGDEVRQIVVLIVQWLAVAGVYFVGVFAVVILVTLAAAAHQGALAVTAGILGGLAVISALAFLLVRFSLAGPQTFAQGRINIFGSWRLTRGRFWPILGSYLLAAIMGIIVWSLVMAIATAAVALFGGGFGAVGQIWSPDTSSLESYFTPAQVIYLLFSGPLAVLITLILYVPAPTIYGALAGEG